MAKLPPGEYTVKRTGTEGSTIIAEVTEGYYIGIVVKIPDPVGTFTYRVPEKEELEPWKWETVMGHRQVTEHTLEGPDILCRYWGNELPSFDARLIGNALELYKKVKILLGSTAPGMHTIVPAVELRCLLREIDGEDNANQNLRG